MARKSRPPGALFTEPTRLRTCQDCGMWISTDVPYYRLEDNTFTHAMTEHCIEGHGDEEWGPDSAEQALERGPQ